MLFRSLPSDEDIEKKLQEEGKEADFPFQLPSIYLEPYRIAERLRELQKEYRSQNPTPGAERRIEIAEECQRLQDQQDHLAEKILEHLHQRGQDIKEVLQVAYEKKRAWEKMRDDKNNLHNKTLLARANKNITILTDFINLFGGNPKEK